MWTLIRKQLTARRLVAVLAAFALGRAALAQEAPKEPSWTTIRTTTLQSLDRRTVELWVDFQIEQLLKTEDSKVIEKIGAAFYANMMKHYKARDASKEFQDGLARIIAASFTKRYQPPVAGAKLPQPLGVAIALMVLRDFTRPSALPCFKAALAEPKPGPRYVAAEGLAAIRQAISDDDWTALLPILQQACIREGNPIALRALYQVLFVQTAGRIDGVIPVLLSILDQRLLLCEQENKFPVEADGQAAAWLATRVARINSPATQNEITRQIARLLADTVDPYLNAQPDEERQEQLEKLIRVAEEQLRLVVRGRVPSGSGIPNPTVTAAVLAGGDERNDKVIAALVKWIGSDAEAGLLNQNPFGFPRGLDIKRKPRVPTTTPVEE